MVSGKCSSFLIVTHATGARRQAVNQDACFPLFDKRRTGTNTHSRTTRQQEFLQSQRPVIVIGKVGTCAGLSGGGVEFFALVLAVMDLDVARVEFGQVFEELRAVTVLGVDQQIVFVG